MNLLNIDWSNPVILPVATIIGSLIGALIQAIIQAFAVVFVFWYGQKLREKENIERLCDRIYEDASTCMRKIEGLVNYGYALQNYDRKWPSIDSMTIQEEQEGKLYNKKAAILDDCYNLRSKLRSIPQTKQIIANSLIGAMEKSCEASYAFSAHANSHTYGNGPGIWDELEKKKNETEVEKDNKWREFQKIF